MLIPAGTRLQVGLDAYINDERNYRHFVKVGGPLRRIHILPIDRTPQQAVSYAFKASELRIPDSNRMLILPKALSELPDRIKRSNPQRVR